MIVLVTGASSGLGKAIAEYLALKGHTVYGTGRSAPTKPVKKDGVYMIQMDVQDDISVNAAVDEIILREGELNALVNNAGIGIGGAVEDMSLADCQTQMDVNFFGMLRVTKACLPHLRQSRGKIVNISSIGGRLGLSYQAMYSASKFAIEGFTEALRKEVRPFGVRAALLEPGDFCTGFTASRKKTTTEDSPYYPYFCKVMAQAEKDEQNGQPPITAAKKVYKILKKRRPKPRYIVANFIQGFAVFASRILPGKLFEKLMMTFYG